jgi:hypothetical protein
MASGDLSRVGSFRAGRHGAFDAQTLDCTGGAHAVLWRGPVANFCYVSEFYLTADAGVQVARTPPPGRPVAGIRIGLPGSTGGIQR